MYLRRIDAESWPVETLTYCWVMVEPPPTPPVSLVPQGAGDAGEVEAGVGVEGAVFGGEHRLPDVLGHLVERDDHPVDVVRADRRQRRAVRVGERRHLRDGGLVRGRHVEHGPADEHGRGRRDQDQGEQGQEDAADPVAPPWPAGRPASGGGPPAGGRGGGAERNATSALRRWSGAGRGRVPTRGVVGEQRDSARGLQDAARAGTAAAARGPHRGRRRGRRDRCADRTVVPGGTSSGADQSPHTPGSRRGWGITSLNHSAADCRRSRDRRRSGSPSVPRT